LSVSVSVLVGMCEYIENDIIILQIIILRINYINAIYSSLSSMCVNINLTELFQIFINTKIILYIYV